MMFSFSNIIIMFYSMNDILKHKFVFLLSIIDIFFSKIDYIYTISDVHYYNVVLLFSMTVVLYYIFHIHSNMIYNTMNIFMTPYTNIIFLNTIINIIIS